MVYSMKDVLAHARKLGIAKSAADAVEDHIRAVLSHQHDYLEAVGLSASQAKQVSA